MALSPCRLATTANIALTSATTAVDGVTLANGDRVLVKDQTTASENGTYLISVVLGVVSWARADNSIPSASIVEIEAGAANADSSWILTTNNPITVGTTSLLFEKYIDADEYRNPMVVGGGDHGTPGTLSSSFGYGSKAEGAGAAAMGYLTTASGQNAQAFGTGSTASGTSSTAVGYQASASGTDSSAIGLQASASNTFATAIGKGSSASGSSATAIGRAAVASGTESFAMGEGAAASSANAIGIGGGGVSASGEGAIAIGYAGLASGLRSVAIGRATTATAEYSVAVGFSADSTHDGSISLGAFAESSAANQCTIGAASSAINSVRVMQANGQSYGSRVLTELHTLAAAATSDTTIQIPAGALVKWVSVRIITAVTGCASIDYGVAGATARYGTGLALAAGTTNLGPDAAGYAQYYGAATSIRFSAIGGGGAFTAGVVRVTIVFDEASVPTS